MSPFPTECSNTCAPEVTSTTRTTPSALISNVLSCEPYSSAFCAINPTFETLPIVVTSNWPCALQSWTHASYIGPYERSGIMHTCGRGEERG